jgi:hypothetical protein
MGGPDERTQPALSVSQPAVVLGLLDDRLITNCSVARLTSAHRLGLTTTMLLVVSLIVHQSFPIDEE